MDRYGKIANRIMGSTLERLERELGRKINIHSQGKVIAQKVEDGEYLIMFSDGEITHAMDKPHAEKIISKWFKKRLHEGIGIGEIEWR